MSFILDALKKSDAKRRAQTGPDFSAPAASPPAASGRRHQRVLVWGLAGFAGLAVIGAGIFWLASRPSGLVDSEQVVAQQTAVVDDRTRERVSEPATETIEVAEVVDEPASVELEATGAIVVATETTTETTTESSPTPSGNSPEQAVQEEPAVPAPDPVSVETLEARLVATTQAANESEVVSDASDNPEATPSPDDDADEADPPWRPEAADYLYQWELPLSVRQSLPALNLLVHVYSEKPDERFVLINGTRFREGDELSSGVRLAEIRPQGALVDFRDYRFLLTQ